jgi:nucleoside-diphosphate-sugar epimerase
VRILVLGGTAFVGRAIVDDALRRDFDVTIFGRGRTGTDLFPGVSRMIGDRETGDYAALAATGWAATCSSRATPSTPRTSGRTRSRTQRANRPSAAPRS